MGAWIETLLEPLRKTIMEVAPYVGAWIETQTGIFDEYIDKSLPTWERGLKPCKRYRAVTGISVAPYVGAWIETR